MVESVPFAEPCVDVVYLDWRSKANGSECSCVKKSLLY